MNDGTRTPLLRKHDLRQIDAPRSVTVNVSVTLNVHPGSDIRQILEQISQTLDMQGVRATIARCSLKIEEE